MHAGVRLPSTTGKCTPPELFCISRYKLGFAVVLECDLVQVTQIEIFPCHIRAVVVKYHHQVLHTTGFIGELEQTRFGYRNFKRLFSRILNLSDGARAVKRALIH